MEPGSLADKIRKARVYHRPPLSRDELALRIRKGSSTVGMYENGDRKPPEDIISRIADATGTPIAWFFDGADTLPPDAMPQIMEGVREPIAPYQAGAPNASPADLANSPQLNLVPYWGTVPAGDWERPTCEDGDTIQVSDQYEDLSGVRAVRVSGSSMEPRLLHGQLVLIKLSTEQRDGVITLAVNQDRELTLKVLRYSPDGWELHSINPEFGKSTAAEWSILGYAIGIEEVNPHGIRP